MKFLTHPMIHFLAGGAALFGLFAWLEPRDAESAPSADDAAATVHIGSGEVAWLQESFLRQWQRPATRDEMVGLMTTHLKEELLAREARSLGLEKDDTLVRRRLAQKLSFLLEDTFRLAEPPDAELRAYFEANKARYAEGARISFRHVFFDPEKRADAEGDARAALGPLNEDNVLVEDLGDRLLIDPVMANADRLAIAAQLGEVFAEAVLALPVGPWEGPVQSAYGVHLVRVDHRVEPEPPVFEDLRPAVYEDWFREHQRKEVAKYFTALMERYRVEVEPEVRGMIGPLDELLPQAIGGAAETP